jgi:phage tail tape-measure protein
MADEAAKNYSENEKTGRLAGAGAGVVAGAQLGTVIIPIPVVGTFTGALVGGIVGSKIGKKVGCAIMDNFSCVRPTGNSKTDVSAELERFATLHAQGIISEEEFKAAKAKLLGL